MARMQFWSRAAAVAALATLLGAATASAQTVSYAQAFDQLAAGCGADINKFCSKVNLGGGRIGACLNQNAAKVSARCRTTWTEVRASLDRRAGARGAVVQACDADRRRFCPDVVAGDANLIDCLALARRRVSASCNQAITDAGYWDR